MKTKLPASIQLRKAVVGASHTLGKFVITLCLWRALVAGYASAAEDGATRFFREHPNEFDAVERGGSVLFANAGDQSPPNADEGRIALMRDLVERHGRF